MLIYKYFVFIATFILYILDYLARFYGSDVDSNVNTARKTRKIKGQ